MASNDKAKKLQALKDRLGQYHSAPISQDDLSELDLESILSIIENFQVYQAELEAQKDELDAISLSNQKLSEDYKNLFEQAPIGFVVLDKDDRIIKSNVMARRILHLWEKTVFDQFLPGHIHAAGGKAKFLAWVHSNATESTPLELQIEEDVAQWISFTKVRSGETVLLSVRDVTNEKLEKDHLITNANRDSLTGLPNRNLLNDRLEQSMGYARRHGFRIAILFIDLDGFKATNDTWGHSGGDAALKHVATELTSTLREVDTLARIGGDEFVAVVQLNEQHEPVPDQLLKRMLEAVNKPFNLYVESVAVSASIGVTFFPQKGDITAEQLIRQADHAMYEAKVQGKNRYVIYDADGDIEQSRLHQNDEKILNALNQNQMVLFYQPQIDLQSMEVLGFEALIRWQHPVRGLVLPAEFIPQTQNTNIGKKIDDWVIDKALSQLARWNANWRPQKLSINISSYSFKSLSFASQLESAFKNYPTVSREQLEIEIVETAVLDNLEVLSGMMRDLIGAGTGFALDDFGTGYSSLSRLQKLPVAVLKIDQSFVRDMLVDEKDYEIVKAVISLASAFNLKTVAEGVETSKHLDALKAMGCDYAQGYAISKPLTAEATEAWYQTWNA